MIEMYISNNTKKITQEFRNYLNRNIKNKVGERLKVLYYEYVDDIDKEGITEFMILYNRINKSFYTASVWHNNDYNKFEKVEDKDIIKRYNKQYNNKL